MAFFLLRGKIASPMKYLRKIHLYLGCLFAPALIFFIITGCWQTFRLHDEKKNGSYHPPAWVQSLSVIHTDQRFPSDARHASSPFKFFVLAMAFSLLVTVSLGILLAFQVSKKNSWMVWLCLITGIALPFLFLRLG